MASFNELKQKALEAAGSLADKSVVVAKNLADNAKILAKKAKLSAEIAAEKDSLKKAYAELGKKCYELGILADIPEVAETIGAITASKAKIEEKQAELDSLKEDDDDDEIVVEIEVSREEPEEEAEADADEAEPVEEPEEDIGE